MLTADSASVVDGGFYPPFATVTDTDHSAWIIITTALCLSCILLFSGIRVFIRWSVTPSVGLDEMFLAASTVLAVIQSSVILGACSKGLGKALDVISVGAAGQVQQMYYASNIFFILSLGLSKISVTLLLLRLTPQQEHRRVFVGIAALIAVWTAASTIAIALQCNLSHPWFTVGETCSGSLLRWQVISVFDIGFELCLVGMTIYLVWSLQTTLETKLTVVFSFGMRLPLLIAISYRLTTFHNSLLTTDPTFLLSPFIVWTQTEMAYSIIAATIPSLRPFIRTLATNYGTAPTNGYGYGSGSGSGSGEYSRTADADLQSGVSYELGGLRPKGKGDEYKYRIWSAAKGGVGPTDTEGGGNLAVERDGVSVGSRESQRMIIRKDLIWEVAAETT